MKTFSKELVQEIRECVTSTVQRSVEEYNLLVRIPVITFTSNGLRSSIVLQTKVDSSGVINSAEAEHFRKNAGKYQLETEMLGKKFIEVENGRNRIYVLAGSKPKRVNNPLVVVDITDLPETKRYTCGQTWLMNRFFSSKSVELRKQTPSIEITEVEFSAKEAKKLKQRIETAVCKAVEKFQLEFDLAKFYAYNGSYRGLFSVSSPLGEKQLIRGLEADLFPSRARQNQLPMDALEKPFITADGKEAIVGGARQRAVTKIFVVYELGKDTPPERKFYDAVQLRREFFSPESKTFREFNGAVSLEEVETAHKQKTVLKKRF